MPVRISDVIESTKSIRVIRVRDREEEEDSA